MNFFLKTNELIFGSDIVDLTHPDCSIDHVNPRFISKICTQKEKITFFSPLHQNETQQILLWSLWSLKESAYKTISRVYHTPYFIYKNFEIQKNLRYVKFKEFTFNAHVFLHKNFVFSSCFYYGNFLLNQKYQHHFYLVSWIQTLNPDSLHKHQIEYSKKIRNYSKKVFLQLLKEKTKICRQSSQDHHFLLPPYLYFRKEFYPISLTHHGNYISFTLAIQKNHIHILDSHFSHRIIYQDKIHIIILEDH